ncbi:BREX system P-loop protein BrxC [Faecalimonas sp.]
MVIRDIFEKKIDRPLEGVVKIGGETDNSKKIELEEYVVTKQVNEHLKTFFKYYLNTSKNGQSDVGVWISGFFGSGKSHFMKMLSYILEGKEVAGKTPIEYLESQIDDNFTLADMKASADIHTDVILFDIDSASDADARNSNEMLVKVFNRKFNELQGFSASMPWLAELERQMVVNGTYDVFKEEYQNIAGIPWEEGRNDDFFGEDNFVQTAVKVNGMTEESARNLYQRAADNFSLTVEDFGKRVREYIEMKGRNHNVVFMVDEVGQYIGKSSELILNLQSIVQTMRTECNGHAWVVVTSQEAIDTVAKNLNPNDFSKVTGRFPVKLSMSSINVDEVIKERILLKNEAATDYLRNVYKEKGGNISAKTIFGGGAPTYPRAKTEKDFIDIYPFFPYQVDLLQSTYNSVRNRGASGKSTSQGERSLLKGFRDAAVKHANDSLDSVIPFSEFYGSLEEELEQDVRIVMERAAKKDTLEMPFDLDVLKILFMIKDMDNEMPATVENLTILMISHIDEDKVALQPKVEKALYRLQQENLIQRDDDKYIFLTNDEQQVEIDIAKQSLDSSEIIDFIGKQVFSGLCDTKIRYSSTFMPTYNQVIDDNPRGPQTSELTMYLYTPYEEKLADSMLNHKTQVSHCLVVTMADNKILAEEIERLLKLEKYIRVKNGKSKSESMTRILTLKTDEFSRKTGRIVEMIENSIVNADYYSKTGRLSGLKGEKAKDRVNDAFRVLIESVYTKLSYIQNPVLKTADLTSRLDVTTHQKSSGGKDNSLAKAEIMKYLERKNEQHMPVTIRGLVEQFQKVPWGWSELDIEGLVAELFAAEDITLQISNKNVAVSDPQIVNYLTKRDYKDTLKVKIKEKTSDELIEAVVDILKNTFTKTVQYNTDGLLATEINKVIDNATERIKDVLESYPKDGQYKLYGPVFKQSADNMQHVTLMYPGYKKVKHWESMFSSLRKIYDDKALFEQFVAEKDQFKNYADEIATIEGFFKNQVNIFNKSCEYIDLYENNKSYMEMTNAKSLAEDMLQVIAMETPYKDIYRLSEANKKFMSILSEVLSKEAAPVNDQIDEDEKTVNTIFEQYEVEKPEKVQKDFEALRTKVDTCQLVSTIVGVKEEAARIRNHYIEVATKKYNEKNKPIDVPGDGPVVTPVPVVVPKTIKNVSVGNLLGVNRKVESVEDVDTVVDAIRKQLLAMVDDNTIINLK